MDTAIIAIQIVTCVMQYICLGVLVYYNHKENKHGR